MRRPPIPINRSQAMGSPRERRETGELLRLVRTIDWPVLEARFGEVYSDGTSMPLRPIRLMAGLAILKHTSTSGEVLCARWIENRYFRYLYGEEFFRHDLPFARSSMTRWRSRMGEERTVVLLQESLSIAVKTGAMKPQDTRRAIVDTTCSTQERDVPNRRQAHPSRPRTAGAAGQTGGAGFTPDLCAGQRYAHAKQFKRANKALRRLRTYLGRTVPDISRQIAGDAELDALFKWSLYQASTVLEQRQRQRGRKI